MISKLLWGVFLLLTFLVTLPISWGVLAKANFFYPVLHDISGIGTHIETYAPKNRKSRLGFEGTSKDIRSQLFAGIVKAIHNDGQGLSELSYSIMQKGVSKPVLLLTEAEVVHLKDVAILLNTLKPVVVTIALIWLMLIIYLKVKKIHLPKSKEFVISASVLLLLCAVVLLFGPEKIFNQMHAWVFPENHQWFFYYEDSLMSTMMKAPVIFAYISGIWVILSIILTALLLKLLSLQTLLGKC